MTTVYCCHCYVGCFRLKVGYEVRSGPVIPFLTVKPYRCIVAELSLHYSTLFHRRNFEPSRIDHTLADITNG